MHRYTLLERLLNFKISFFDCELYISYFYNGMHLKEFSIFRFHYYTGAIQHYYPMLGIGYSNFPHRFKQLRIYILGKSITKTFRNKDSIKEE